MTETATTCRACLYPWPAAILDNSGRCPQCGLDNVPVLPEGYRRDRNGFPLRPCSRCGGSGHYSYCAQYGTTCFGCSGTGLAYAVPKHHAAWRDELRAMVRVIAQDLRHGDRVRPWGERPAPAAREVIAIEVDREYRTGWSTAPDGTETAHAWRTTITWDDGTVAAMSGATLFHRVGVHLDPAPYVARAERGVRYLQRTGR